MTPTRSINTGSNAPMAKDDALRLADRVDRIKPSPTLAVSARAEELQAAGKKIINLSVGEPDFDTPDHIKEAAIVALKAGKTKYTAVDGIKPLKAAIANKFKSDNQLDYDLNQIIVSCGAKHSLYNILVATLNPGDEVIIPAPYWVSYPDMVKLTDGVPVIAQTSFDDQFKLMPQQLEKLITPKTRILFLNSPSNPTGMAYTKSELEALGNVLIHHPNILIMSDDIYEKNLWHHLPFTNILNACPELKNRTIIINGVAKTYAMTGWRIGYAAGPASIVAAMKKAQSQSTSSPTTVSQYATLAALEGDQSAVSMMTNAYKERHDFIVKALQAIEGFECTSSDGTFYTFPSVKKLMRRGGFADDIAFCEYLLTAAEIAVIPGSAFGTEGHIRISYATKMENLIEAVSRLKQAITAMPKA